MPPHKILYFKTASNNKYCSFTYITAPAYLNYYGLILSSGPAARRFLSCLQEFIFPLRFLVIRISGKIGFHQNGRLIELAQILICHNLIKL